MVVVDASAFTMLLLETKNTSSEKTATADNAKCALFIFTRHMQPDTYLTWHRNHYNNYDYKWRIAIVIKKF